MRLKLRTLAQIAFVSFALIALPTTSHGGSTVADLAESGNTFLASCEKATDVNDTSINSFSKGLCLGYVTGVSDGIVMAETLTHHPSYCRPANADNGQVFDLVVKFVKDHPEVRHWQTRELIIRSMVEAFPCPTARKPK